MLHPISDAKIIIKVEVCKFLFKIQILARDTLYKSSLMFTFAVSIYIFPIGKSPLRGSLIISLNMTKKFRMILAGVVAILGLTACNDNEAETITEQTITDCFAYVTDITTNSEAAYSGVNYKIRLNYTQGKAEITINNLRTPDGKSYPSLVLSEVPFTISENGWKVIKGSDITPKASGFSGVPLFNSFEMRLLDRIVNNGYKPGFSVRFTLNMTHSVLSSDTQQVQFGTTITTSESGEETTTIATSYLLEFNPDTKQVTITMANSQFVPSMPPMNIVLPNISFTVSGTSAIFSASDVTPKIGDTPYPAFPITNLRGTYDFNEGLRMSFDCDPQTVNESFSVTTECSYNEIPTGI